MGPVSSIVSKIVRVDELGTDIGISRVVGILIMAENSDAASSIECSLR